MGSIKKRALPFSNAERTEPLTLATSVLSPQDVVLTKAAVIQQGIPLLEVTNADETSNSHFRLRRPIPQRLTPLSSASLTAPTVAAGLIPMRSVPQAATIISGSASRNSRIDMARSIPASISEGITPLSSEYSKQFTTVLPSVITANISNSYESFSNQDALSEASSTSPRPLDIKPKPMKDLGKKGIESWNHFYTHIEKARVSTVSIGFLKWCFHEFFYTAIESIYFSKNEFIDILKILGILPSQKISRKYLGMLRRILGKPRRTSRKFFEEQREKFASYKDVVRKLQNKQSDSSVLTPPTEGVPHLLSPGAIVSAFHPLTRYIHEGIVEGFGFGFYVIRFEHEELGTMTVEDDEVMGQEPLFSILDFDTDDSSLFHKYRSLDIYRCARFQTLLDQKRSIIDHLVQINNAFDAYVSDPNLL